MLQGWPIALAAEFIYFVEQRGAFNPIHFNHRVDLALGMGCFFDQNPLWVVLKASRNLGGMGGEIRAETLIAELHIRVHFPAKTAERAKLTAACAKFVHNRKAAFNTPGLLDLADLRLNLND